MYNEERKFVRSTLMEGNVTGYFEAEKYDGDPLLDTACTIKIEDFSITWKDAGKMMEELSAVIEKYRI